MADFMRDHMVKKLQGSYTVEAAVLIPLAFVLVLLSVSYSLIYYDRTALCAGIHEIAQKEGFQKHTEENTGSVPSALSQISVEIEQADREIIVNGSGKSRFLSPIIRMFFFLKEPYLENQEKVCLIYGEQAVRERKIRGEYTGESGL